MADFTLGPAQFPAGTVVGVYLRKAFVGEAGPFTSTVTTAMTDAQLVTEFSGLEFDTQYWAAAQVGGSWRRVSFRTERDTSADPATQGYVGAAVAALTKSDVGLGNVDNTSDAAKPISTAAQAVLDTHAADIAVVKEAPLNVDHAPYGGDIAAAITALPVTGGELYIPGKSSRRVGSNTITGKGNLTVIGDGAASVLHNAAAGEHALSIIDVNQLTVKDLRVQGEAGTLDGLYVENCQRAAFERVMCQGSGRYGIHTQRTFGVGVDHCGVGIDVTSPFPTGVANCTDGLVLDYDGVDISSGPNQFNVKAGHYAVGKDRGWAIRIVRAEGGNLDGPIAELSKGAILLDRCKSVLWFGYYAEFNPTAQEYTAGTATATNGSAVVTGSGTAWNTLDGEGAVVNAAPGKWLLIGGRAARIASVQSNTQLTLEENWTWATATAQPYRCTSADIVLDNCRECHGMGGYGAGAIILRDSSRNSFKGAVCEQVFFSIGSDYNRRCYATTNRGSSSTGRRQDYGNGNWCETTSYASGLIAEHGAEGWRAVGASGQPAFEGAWVNEGSGTYQDAGFFADGEGVVHLRGVVKSGTLGAGAFTLPAGYRPAKYTEFAVVSNNAFGKLGIYAAGYVVPLTGATTHFSLDGVSFRAEQ